MEINAFLMTDKSTSVSSFLTDKIEKCQKELNQDEVSFRVVFQKDLDVILPNPGLSSKSKLKIADFMMMLWEQNEDIGFPKGRTLPIEVPREVMEKLNELKNLSALGPEGPTRRIQVYFLPGGDSTPSLLTGSVTVNSH